MTKIIIEYIRKLVRKSYTPVVPIANTCSIGYPHDGRADNAAYRHDRRADNAAYRHDRRADSLSQIIGLGSSRSKLYLFLLPIRTHLISDRTNRFPLSDLILHEAHILHNDLLK